MVDVFGLNMIEYAPFLLKNKAQLKAVEHLVFYSSHLQQEDMAMILGKIEIDPFPLQLWP